MHQRILLLARDMVGDLVNTTGAVARVRERFPNAHIVLEGGPAAGELFPNLEVWLRRRHGGLSAKLKRILAYRRAGFELALILDDSRDKIRRAVLAGIPLVVGVARDTSPIGKARILPFDPSGHDLFDSLRAVLREVGALEDVAPELPIRDEHRNHAEARTPAILLHVGASDTAKSWPKERWIELARDLGNRCVVAAGPGEEPLRDWIAAAADVDSLPTLGLLDYAAVIEKMYAIVSSDTSAAHIAGAVGTPSVVLYGPTDPARFHPWARSIPIWLNFGCEHYGTGCLHVESNRCSQACMRAVTVDLAKKAVESTLSQ